MFHRHILSNVNLLFVSVTGRVRARCVTIQGPRGRLTRSFRHLAVDISMVDSRTIKVEKWFGKRKELAAVNTVCSHIDNMIKGVTKVKCMPMSIDHQDGLSGNLHDTISKDLY